MSTTSSTLQQLEKEQYMNEIEALNRARGLAIDDFSATLASAKVDRISTAEALIQRLVPALVEEYDNLKKSKPRGANKLGILREVDSDVLAVLTLRTIIQGCLKGGSSSYAQTIMINLGYAIWLEYILKEATRVDVNTVFLDEEKNKKQFLAAEDTLRRRARHTAERILGEDAVKRPENGALLHLGKYGIDYLVGLQVIQKTSVKVKQQYMQCYVLTHDVEAFIIDSGYGQAALSTPTSDFMVCPPREWSSTQWGGYLTPQMMAANPILTRGSTRDIQEVRRADKALGVVNYLQSTALELSTDTVGLVRAAWAVGGGVLGLPSTTPKPKPVFPLAEDWAKEDASEEEMALFRGWARETSWWYTAEIERKQAVLRVTYLLQHLVKFTGRSVWCPVYLDWRGRAYYCGMVNPQSCDYLRACLVFKEKKRLGKRGLFWLKVHIANSLGFDKESFDRRARWTEDNWDDLVQGCEAPWDCEPYKSCEDYPVTACAAVRELREAYKLRKPEDFLSGIPVHMDASCSGQQIFSGILRDTKTALTVNVKPRADGRKADIYSDVAAVITRKLQELDTDEARVLLSLGPDRSLCKKPVMTQPYGASVRTFNDACCSWILSKDVSLRPLAWPLAMYLTKVLIEALEESIPAVTACMEWFKEVCRENRGESVCWQSPLGFKVVQDYMKYTVKRIRVRSINHETLQIMAGTRGINNRRMVNAVSPNIVHTYDAGLMGLAVLKCKEAGLSVLSIHDSQGTHPCDVDAFHKIIRRSYVELFEDNDVLEDICRKNNVECPLSKGDLDVQDALKSQFFYS